MTPDACRGLPGWTEDAVLRQRASRPELPVPRLRTLRMAPQRTRLATTGGCSQLIRRPLPGRLHLAGFDRKFPRGARTPRAERSHRSVPAGPSPRVHLDSDIFPYDQGFARSPRQYEHHPLPCFQAGIHIITYSLSSPAATRKMSQMQHLSKIPEGENSRRPVEDAVFIGKLVPPGQSPAAFSTICGDATPAHPSASQRSTSGSSSPGTCTTVYRKRSASRGRVASSPILSTRPSRAEGSRREPCAPGTTTRSSPA